MCQFWLNREEVDSGHVASLVFAVMLLPLIANSGILLVMKKISLVLGCVWLTFAQQGEHVREGNLALRTPQQPNPFFAFGQNVNDKGDIIGLIYIDWLRGCKQHSVDIVPGLIYQPTKNFSLYTTLPVAVSSNNGMSDVAMADIFIQGEYAWFSKTTQLYTVQSTIVANVTAPTGEQGQGFFTGMGSPSFFLGTTTEYVTPAWYTFYSLGVIFPVLHHGTKAGNNFLYQTGICRNIAYESNKWLLSALVEFFGIYAQRDRICGVQDLNTGGNTFYIGPSIWYATPKSVIQIAAAFPIAQYVNGNQPKNRYWLGAEFRWTFNG